MKSVEPEFFRPVDVCKTEHPIALTANEAECAAIARRLGILGVDHLSAEIRLSRKQGGLIKLKGHLKARVAQSCVVTLEPVPEEVSEDFEETFTENPEAGPVSEADMEAPEVIENGRIDAGEVVVQYLSLALNPYPRKAGAEFKSSQDEA